MTATRIRIRVLANSVVAIGPGKADLLDAIAATGSISAAARQLRMSYRRAWILVETMNACFNPPLVTTKKGGASKGGATLTAAGKHAVAEYRELADEAARRFVPLLRRARDLKKK